MRAPLAARRELAGDQNMPPKVWRYYMFLNIKRNIF